MEETKENRSNLRGKVIKMVLLYFVIYIVIAVYCGFDWAYDSFNNCNLEKIIFQLSEPLDGTSSDVIVSGILNIFGKSLLILTLLNILYFLVIKFLRNVLKLKDTIISIIKVILVLIVIIEFCIYSWIKVDVGGYIKNIVTASSFIEDNYVDPNSVKITFPEEKRNLIFIVLESMEVSFMDEAHGGALDTNLIPEITNLMEENISFTNKEDGHGGAQDVAGTGWTIGALASETTGLPLKVAGFNTANDPNENFMPGAVGLGDLLKKEGYNQLFICGSPIEFGGRDNFYRLHGNYEILDYNRAVEEKRYTGEKVNWGFPDYDLYEYAKQEIIRLSKDNKPFNVTFLTADTHHPVGYICTECTNEYDYEYYNVVRCASRQVGEFVEWAKTQDFYDNTTIVILGDHPTMVSDPRLCITKDYTRTMVNVFINPIINDMGVNLRTPKQITSMDFYPTILSSLGVSIEGDKLGLGTNLFLNEKTLGDKFGISKMDEEIKLRSEFYINNILKD